MRQFIRDNALRWPEEFRLDGLRFDMTVFIRNVYGRRRHPENRTTSTVGAFPSSQHGTKPYNDRGDPRQIPCLPHHHSASSLACICQLISCRHARASCTAIWFTVSALNGSGPPVPALLIFWHNRQP